MDVKDKMQETLRRLSDIETPLQMKIASLTSYQTIEKSLKVLREDPDITLEEYEEIMKDEIKKHTPIF